MYPTKPHPAAGVVARMGVGGYGRGEMAPHGDCGMAVITPYKPAGWTEQVIGSMLYSLCELRLKVGHSSRAIDETMRMAREYLTIRTALLEGRYIWGDQ